MTQQQQKPPSYVVAHVSSHTKAQMTPLWFIHVEAVVQRFRMLEDILLLWSLPALLGSFFLSTFSAASETHLPLLAVLLDLLVSLITLIVASLVFFKWVDALQQQSRAAMHIMNEENARRFLGTSAVCLLLLVLVVMTAISGGGGPQVALQLLVFFLLVWHYRTLLKRFSKR